MCVLQIYCFHYRGNQSPNAKECPYCKLELDIMEMANTVISIIVGALQNCVALNDLTGLGAVSLAQIPYSIPFHSIPLQNSVSF